MSDQIIHKTGRLIKGLLFFLLKFIYIGAFFFIAILLLRLLYFPNADRVTDNAAIKDGVFEEYALNEETIEEYEKKEFKVSPGHFHIVDESLAWQESNPPLCLKCHGIYPHIKNKKTMSFLNLHIGFTACEVCHLRKSEGDNRHIFRWIDLETGKAYMQVKGGYGKYKARIVPMMNIDGKHIRLDKIIGDKFSNVYQDMKEKKYTLEQQQKKTSLLHDQNLSKKPVTCIECHKSKGYMNFNNLGFPRNRINQLVSSEVSNMLEQYDTFHMPKMLNFR